MPADPPAAPDAPAARQPVATTKRTGPAHKIGANGTNGANGGGPGTAAGREGGPPPSHTKTVRRRRWPRRLLIGANITVATLLILVAGGYAFINYKFGQIDRLNKSIKEVLTNGGKDTPGSPMNVLIVGSDSRADLDPNESKAFGKASVVGGQRADVIMILHVDPAEEKAAVLSIPRDVFLPIADRGRSDKINSAYDGNDKDEGPTRLTKTITQNFGIPINHFIEVNFDSFQAIVDAVDGVKVNFPYAVKDTFTGLNIKTPGCINLNGKDALAYARSRHFQLQLKPGAGFREDPTSDIDRIKRQQDFIRIMMKKAIGKVTHDPTSLLPLVNAGVNNLRIDPGLSKNDILKLGKQLKGFDPDKVDMLTMPNFGKTLSSGEQVLIVQQPAANQVIARFNSAGTSVGETDGSTTATTVAGGTVPSDVEVRVLNGSGRTGEAQRVSNALVQQGFVAAGTGTSTDAKTKATVIHFAPGADAKARLVQSYLANGGQLKEDSSLSGADVMVVTGSDAVTVKPPPGATPSKTTPTTAAKANEPATTTTTSPFVSQTAC